MKKRIWKDLSRSWSKHTSAHVATLTILIATFFVGTTFLTASLNLKRIFDHWGKSVNFTIYLQDGLQDEEVSIIRHSVENIGAFEQIEFVSKEQAKTEFNQDLTHILPQFVQSSSFGNPFPASFRLGLKEKWLSGKSVDDLATVAKKMAGIAGVEDLSYGQDWVENYRSFLTAVDSFGWVVVIVLLIGSMLVLGNSLRTSIVNRREEIEVLELVGATYSMIRRPYIVEGAIHGFTAGVVALSLTAGIYYFSMDALRAETFLRDFASQFQFLSWFWMASVLVMTTLLGLFGSYFAVRSINQGWAAKNRVAG